MAQIGSAQLLHRRVLSGAAQMVQLWFDAVVLEKYRSVIGAQLLRSNTVGRLKLSQWSVDFGIAQALIHLSVADAQARIPESEWEHWASHAATLPLSEHYVTMQLTKGACIDDGETRPW